MTVMATPAIVAQRDAAEEKAREELARFDLELGEAGAWAVYRTMADEEEYAGRTYSAEAALAYLRLGHRVERAA